MKASLLILVSLALAAQPAPLFAEKKYDGHYFDGSTEARTRQGQPRGGLRGPENLPRTPALRSNLKDVPPVQAAAAPAAAAQSKEPHMAWDWDKTVVAAGGALAGAAVGFLLGGPIGAAVGFVAGMFLGAIAGNMMEEKKKDDAPKAS